jgi:sulfite reductase alpha subunit-like flavoprotein
VRLPLSVLLLYVCSPLVLSDNFSMNHDPRSQPFCNPLILYATETGTAQDVGDRIARHCRRIHAQSRVVNMANYPPVTVPFGFRCVVVHVSFFMQEELISEQLVIFVVSTTATGLEPRSMTPLWTLLLRSSLPSDLFEDLEFAVFGLGDTAYEKFCWPAKKLCRRIEGLGATEICARGEGDEQHQLGSAS